jgi:hypothetical protein
MKQLFTKISSVLLAIVVVFSTMSFSISEHYCGDYLVDTGIFSKAESCGMEMETDLVNAITIDGCSIEKSNCCQDLVKHIEGQQILKVDNSSLSIEKQNIVAAFLFSYLHIFEDFPLEITPYQNYTPPLIVKDILLLDQVFLI